MKTRYKIGKFSQEVKVQPGDIVNLTLTESNGEEQRVSETIMIQMTVTHWLMFYVPGIGFGGMFGGPDIEANISEIFLDPEYVSDGEMLIS